MKTKRGLSGIYLRFKNSETNKYENRCFEDLPHEEQLKCMKGKGTKWLESMIILLSNALNEIGECTDITKE